MTKNTAPTVSVGPPMPMPEWRRQARLEHVQKTLVSLEKRLKREPKHMKANLWKQKVKDFQALESRLRGVLH